MTSRKAEQVYSAVLEKHMKLNEGQFWCRVSLIFKFCLSPQKSPRWEKGKKLKAWSPIPSDYILTAFPKKTKQGVDHLTGTPLNSAGTQNNDLPGQGWPSEERSLSIASKVIGLVKRTHEVLELSLQTWGERLLSLSRVRDHRQVMRLVGTSLRTAGRSSEVTVRQEQGPAHSLCSK